MSTQKCNYSFRYCVATSLQRGQALAWPRWREVAAQKIWPVPKAVVTVFCTPDDGSCWHPKHVEWTCRIINRLLCVGSRWTIINPLNAELNPICHLLELLRAHHIFHFSRLRVNIEEICYTSVLIDWEILHPANTNGRSLNLWDMCESLKREKGLYLNYIHSKKKKVSVNTVTFTATVTILFLLRPLLLITQYYYSHCWWW